MKTNKTLLTSMILASIMNAGCEYSDDDNVVNNAEGREGQEKIFTPYIGTDLNSKSSSFLSFNPQGPGGAPNQSLRGGDVLIGGHQQDDILIGGLGVDILVGYSGDDILIGGTEDFNSSVDGDAKGADNRDRAFGNEGNDVFIWAPGDGSDFFDGGEGIDVLVFGILGEKQDSDGSTEGAPFFNVNPPSKTGSQDFDGIFLDEQNQPVVSVSTSPGFCSLIDAVEHAEHFEVLDIDQVIRFSLRGVANAFDGGEQSEDDGLRVAVSAKDVEFLVCTERNVVEGGGETNIQVLDLTNNIPTVALLSDLPEYVQALIQ